MPLCTADFWGSHLLPINYWRFYHHKGLIFDLIEILADQLKRNRLGTVPFYYVAPMSKDSLAHAQIYPEFLSVEKQNKAAAPEFPFTHDDAIENGRLKIFEHATEGTFQRTGSNIYWSPIARTRTGKRIHSQ